MEKQPIPYLVHYHATSGPLCGAKRRINGGLVMATFWEAVTCGECLRLGKVVRENDASR